jgi:hypothetical protein
VRLYADVTFDVLVAFTLARERLAYLAAETPVRDALALRLSRSRRRQSLA